MHKTILFLTAFLLICTIHSFAQNISIPDPVFKNYLLKNALINTDADKSEISLVEAEMFTGEINVNSLSITSLKGIEAFKNITSLGCTNNKLSTLDVSANTRLTWFNCSNNQLNSLDVSKNIALTSFFCQYNFLTSLDLSKNVSLANFGCTDNLLKELDLKVNSNLSQLYCEYNQLTTLDLSNNPKIYQFNCSFNLLTELNTSNFTQLQIFNCAGNKLSGLDLANNIDLSNLNCSANPLTSLDITNNRKLGIGKGGQFTCTNTPELKVICVFSVDQVSANTMFLKDATTEWSETCAVTGNGDAFEGHPLQVIYPNPALDFIDVGEGFQSSIYNAGGRLLIQTHATRIDIRLLHPGVYFIERVGENGKHWRDKLTKI